MPGSLFAYLAEDHHRLGALVRQSVTAAGMIDRTAYSAFRAGLLRHIGIEERILFPAARRWRGGEALPITTSLHRDHAVLAALLVPTPTPAIIASLQSLLERHNTLEEEPDGLYDACDHLAGTDADAVLAEIRAAPEVPVAPHVDTPAVFHNIEVLLAAASEASRS